MDLVLNCSQRNERHYLLTYAAYKYAAYKYAAQEITDQEYSEFWNSFILNISLREYKFWSRF
jgi:hypothetical protein